MACKFRGSGQTCISANRILVQDSVYDKVAEMLVAKVKEMKMGHGYDAGITQGPLINIKGVEKSERHVNDCLAKGAKLLCGGKRATDKGSNFFQPTVLSGVDSTMAPATEETFGPIAALFRFKTEEEAIAIANNTTAGLAAYFYAQNIARITRVYEGLEYGMVACNTGMFSTWVAPFGGIKESGYGREGMKYGIDGWMNTKYVAIAGL